MNKSSRLRSRLDALHRSLIFLMYRAECVTCGSRESLEVSHLFTRSAMETRWDYMPGYNCTIQCTLCNRRHEDDTGPLFLWFIREHGVEKFECLRIRSLQVRYYTITALQEKIETFTQLVQTARQVRADMAFGKLPPLGG